MRRAARQQQVACHHAAANAAGLQAVPAAPAPDAAGRRHSADHGVRQAGDREFGLGSAGAAQQRLVLCRKGLPTRGDALRRSEEHTSELQSLMRISYAVFCLKKKTTAKNTSA